MKYLKAPNLSMNFNESVHSMKKRFENILNDSIKKKGIVTLVLCLIIIVVIGGIIKIKSVFSESLELLSVSDRATYYIDFAMKNRIDFIPDFEENRFINLTNPVSSEEFLMFVYYIKNEELPEDLTMSKELVESVMREYFGIENVSHKSLFKTWSYDDEKEIYTPVPQGTAEESIFDTVRFSSYKVGEDTVYDVTLREYSLPYIYTKYDDPSFDIYSEYLDYSISDDNYYVENVRYLLKEKGNELKDGKINVYDAICQMIKENKTDGFTIGKTIRIKYYINSETGNPRFIYKNENFSDYIFPEKYDEVVYENRPDGISDRFVKIRKGKYWGILDSKGREILNPDKYKLDSISINTYEEVWPVIEVDKNGLCGMIDYYGNVVVEPKWEKVFMDIYNVPDVVFVFDGERWGGIRLTFEDYKNVYEYESIKTSEIDYSIKLSDEINI